MEGVGVVKVSLRKSLAALDGWALDAMVDEDAGVRECADEEIGLVVMSRRDVQLGDETMTDGRL
jgi:hypothetical protein